MISQDMLHTAIRPILFILLFFSVTMQLHVYLTSEWRRAPTVPVNRRAVVGNSSPMKCQTRMIGQEHEVRNSAHTVVRFESE